MLALVIASVFGALWRRSVLETRRAEAQKLIAMGQVRLDDYPTAALSYATQSLELADSEEARFLALEALWKGPTAFVVNDDPTVRASFSRGGNWLVQSHDMMSSLAVISRDGTQRIVDVPAESDKTRTHAFFGALEDIFVTLGGPSKAEEGRISLYSAPEGRLLATAKPVDDANPYYQYWAIDAATGNPRAVFVFGKEDLVTVDALYTDGGHERLGEFHLAAPVGEGAAFCMPEASSEWLGVVEGNDVSIVQIRNDGLSDRRLLGRHEGDPYAFCSADPLGRFLATFTPSGEIKQWDWTGENVPLSITGPHHPGPKYSRDGSHLTAEGRATPESTQPSVWIWKIDETTARLRRQTDIKEQFGGYDFDPIGLWLAMKGPLPANRLWSLSGRRPVRNLSNSAAVRCRTRTF